MQAHPFIESLNPAHAAMLVAVGRCVDFESGKYLWRQGDRRDALILVKSGEVAVEISVPGQGSIPVDHMVSNEVLDWSWMDPQSRSEFDARAVTPVQAIFFDGKQIRDICQQDHVLACEMQRLLMRVLTTRLQKAWKRRLRFGS